MTDQRKVSVQPHFKQKGESKVMIRRYERAAPKPKEVSHGDSRTQEARTR